jgi:hypothetical protein
MLNLEPFMKEFCGKAQANELRNDAARRAKVRGRALRAAASIRVERSRTPRDPALLEIKV